MTPSRSESIDYTSQCTVSVDYGEGGTGKRIVYERPQMQVPDRPLTELERVTMLIRTTTTRASSSAPHTH
jgi:hypothetical protein